MNNIIIDKIVKDKKCVFCFLSTNGFDSLFPLFYGKETGMKYLLIMILLVLLTPVCALNQCYAQTNDLKSTFQAADTNRDGKMSADEFKRYVKQAAFSKMDKDGDKKIDKKEWQAADLSPRAEANLQAADQDRNQTIEFLEFSRHADHNYNYDEMFNALDRNRDGSLAPDEFNARPAFTIFSIKF